MSSVDVAGPNIKTKKRSANLEASGFLIHFAAGRREEKKRFVVQKYVPTLLSTYCDTKW